MRKPVKYYQAIDFEDYEALNQFFNDVITHPLKDIIVAIADGDYKGIVGFDFK